MRPLAYSAIGVFFGASATAVAGSISILFLRVLDAAVGFEQLAPGACYAVAAAILGLTFLPVFLIAGRAGLLWGDSLWCDAIGAWRVPIFAVGLLAAPCLLCAWASLAVS